MKHPRDRDRLLRYQIDGQEDANNYEHPSKIQQSELKAQEYPFQNLRAMTFFFFVFSSFHDGDPALLSKGFDMW